MLYYLYGKLLFLKNQKQKTHEGDAEVAVKTFINKYPNVVTARKSI